MRKTTPEFQEPMMEMEAQQQFMSSSIKPDSTGNFQGSWNSNESFFFFLSEIWSS